MSTGATTDQRIPGIAWLIARQCPVCRCGSGAPTQHLGKWYHPRDVSRVAPTDFVCPASEHYEAARSDGFSHELAAAVNESAWQHACRERERRR